MTSTTFPRRLVSIALGGLTLAATFGCNSADTPRGGNNQAGAVIEKPDGEGFFIVDENNRGLGQDLHIVRLAWGRLVDVFGLDSAGEPVPMQRDFAIGGALVSNTNQTLSRSPVTNRETLTILRDVTTPEGRAEFFTLLKAAEINLTTISDEGLGGVGLFTMVPRNAVVVIQMDDLIDPETISGETVRVVVGVPSTTPFEGRIVADPNHGDLADPDGDGELDFYPTRILVDSTVSEAESFASGEPLPINNGGFPPSASIDVSNVAIRIPTRASTSVGQETVVENLTGHELDVEDNGTVDLASQTDDVVRVMRSGGSTLATGDPFNGFLPDQTPPRVVGRQGIAILEAPVQDPDDPTLFTLPSIAYDSITCAETPVPGDVIEQQGVLAEVIEEPLPQSGGSVFDLVVRLGSFPADFDGPGDWVGSGVGSAQILSAFDPATDTGREACFVQIFPVPGGAPDAPAADVSTNATFGLLFNEPMDPGSASAYDSLALARVADPGASDEFVVGSLDQSLDLLEVIFVPDMPLAHESGESETYFLLLREGPFAVTDLAGNALQGAAPAPPLAPISIQVDPDQVTQINSGRAVRFTSPDEDEPFGEQGELLPEFSGQHFYDLQRELIRPRPVTRFEAVADRTQCLPGLMFPIAGGTRTPLTKFGSKTQIIWRHLDVGLGLQDITTYNVDVEGLNWAPLGTVQTDNFGQFEIRVAHAKFFPDEEMINVPPLIPVYPASGLVSRFSENVLDPTRDPLRVIHPRNRGYSINPGAMFLSSSGTAMVPFPLNQNLPQNQFTYYTWRNTAVQTRGGHPTGSAGVDTLLFETVCNADTSPPPALYPAGEVATVGLPLLMEFRVFPDSGANSGNAFDVSFVHTASTRPFFRSWSSGGISASGNDFVDPDLETTANGGFNPLSSPPGAPQPGQDNVFYMGSMDLVTRISRSCSIWYTATDPLTGEPMVNTRFNEPVLEPNAERQPLGTRIELALRGASVNTNTEARQNALTLDAYGDHYSSGVHGINSANVGITFQNDGSWIPVQPGSPNPTGIDGARYYQIRITFIANAESGQFPLLSALGLTWRQGP